MSDHGAVYAVLCIFALACCAVSCIDDHRAGRSIGVSLVASILAACLFGATLLHFVSGGRV
jgi:hypothetical protein